jgi:hypothetical protein
MGFNALFKALNVTLARNSVAYPKDDLRIEICWSDFKSFNVKKCFVCALVGVLII